MFSVHHDQNFVAPKRRGRRSKESKLIAANPSQVEVLDPSKNKKNVNGMLEIGFKFNNNHNTFFHQHMNLLKNSKLSRTRSEHFK